MTPVEAQPLKPGDALAHFRIDRAIGEGATGVVYRAHDLALDRTVGLKVLKPEASQDLRFVGRFLREARAAARVSHPNLAHIYFVGEQDGHHFFAMEFIEGRDLQAEVEAEGALDLDTVLALLEQVARGLRAAHRASVVHRDVKPSNILVQPDGVARVTDFGLARSIDTDLHTTQADTILGTPTFMSPEQCRSRAADERADIYALGLTAWFLLAGRLPYEAESLGQLIDDQLNTPLPSLLAVQPDLPEALDTLLQRMCAKAPEDRYANMDEVLEAIAGVRPHPVLPGSLVARAVAAAIDLLPAAGVVALVDLGAQRLLGTESIVETRWGGISGVLLFAAYHIGCELRWGASLGKWLLQLQVVSNLGVRPRARVVVPRFVLRYPFVVVEVLSLGRVLRALGWVGASLQIGVIVASFVTYAALRQRSLSDLLTRTRVALRLTPKTRDAGIVSRPPGRR